MMQTRIKKINVLENKRLIFLSDIHANLTLFKDTLNKVKFTKDDYLFVLGDVIEKGNDNLKTLDYIMKLINDGYSVTVIKGNCDEVLENINIYSKEEIMKYKTFKKGNSIINEILNKENLSLDDISKDRLLDIVKNKYKKYYTYLKSLNHIVIVNDLIYLSHAGIDDIEDISLNAKSVTRNEYFYNKESNFNKLQIVGHLPVMNYNNKYYDLNNIIDINKNIIVIDGGNNIINFGQLNVLVVNNIKDMNFENVYIDDLNEVKIKEDYRGNEDISFNLKFGTYLVDVLKDTGDFYYININDLNIETYIHKEFVYIKDNEKYIHDASNLFLTLKKGEKVKLCLKGKPYSYIKKNNIVGLCLTSLLDI